MVWSIQITRVWPETDNIELKLPHDWKIHPIFHASLLESYKANTLPDRTQPALSSILVKNELEYVMDEVLDSKID